MVKIGGFRESFGNDYPPLSECIDYEPIAENDIVLRYLRSFKPVAAAPMIFIDYFTGERIPGEALCFTDGQYSWRSDLCHYFERYNFRLPVDFIEMILSKTAKRKRCNR